MNAPKRFYLSIEKMAMKKQQAQPTNQRTKPSRAQNNNDKVSTFRQKMAMQQAEKQRAEHAQRLAQLENERVEREQAERATTCRAGKTKAQQQKDESKREWIIAPVPFREIAP